MQTSPAELIQQINALIDHKFDSLQAWTDMRDWPLGATRRIGRTTNTKIYDDGKVMKFLSCFPPLTEMDEQWHDCNEYCRIITNTLADKVSAREWNAGGVAVFGRGQKHTPYNPSPTETTWIEVVFEK